jgi:hypothetical protein
MYVRNNFLTYDFTFKNYVVKILEHGLKTRESRACDQMLDTKAAYVMPNRCCR